MSTKPGALQSTDSGSNWTAVNTGLPHAGTALNTAIVWALAIDPLTPNRLYAGTLGGVFRSTDGGANWTALMTGVPNGAPKEAFGAPAKMRDVTG